MDAPLFLTPDDATVRGARGGVRLAFQSANRRPTLLPLDRMAGGTNYLIGANPSAWRRNVGLSLDYKRFRHRKPRWPLA